MPESTKPSGPMTASEKARKFYEDHATNIVNVPREGHPEDKSGWDGVPRASEARFVAGDCLVMTLAEAIDFAAKFAASELTKPSSCQQGTPTEKPMTVSAAIRILTGLCEHGLSGLSVVKAYDGDSGRLENVTGFLYDDYELEICTDED
jgi:hypothetical protein